jgi:putative Holliday junction resolvase
LGLDIGDKRIGVSLSDPSGILASPFTIIHRRDLESDIKSIKDILSLHQVERVIVGLPISMNGRQHGQADKVRNFVEFLREQIGIPLEYRDERLSTRYVRRLMNMAGSKKSGYDAMAAAIILQGYLDEDVK